MMSRAASPRIRPLALAVMLLCLAGTVSAGPAWSPADSPSEDAASPLLEITTVFETPALLRLQVGMAEAPTGFARDAASVATVAPATGLSEPALAEALMDPPAAEAPPSGSVATAPLVPTVPETPAAVPPVQVASGPTVLDQLAFETTLEAQFAGRAPAPELQPVWARIASLYRENLYRPMWRDDARWSASARSALARIALARDDALSLPAVAPASLVDGAPETIAAQDLALTSAVVAYARQASGGRVDRYAFPA